MTDFSNLSKEEALKYCYEHENQFKAECYACGDNGERQFGCLIEILEGDTIKPSELPDYGMEFE